MPSPKAPLNAARAMTSRDQAIYETAEDVLGAIEWQIIETEQERNYYLEAEDKQTAAEYERDLEPLRVLYEVVRRRIIGCDNWLKPLQIDQP
jgi:hypothetical protein